MVLVVIGIPPVLLGLVLALSVREPARRAASLGVSAGDPGLARYLRGAWRMLLPFYIGAAALSLFLYGAIAWVPVIEQRLFGLRAATAGLTFGVIGMGGGLIGAVLWPFVVARIERRGIAHGAMIVLCGASALFGPLMAIGPACTALVPFLAILGVGLLGSSVVGILPSLVIQNYGAPHVRARLMAMLLLAQNVVGLGAGPWLVARLALLWPGRANAIGLALGTTGAAMAATAAIAFFFAWRALRHLAGD